MELSNAIGHRVADLGKFVAVIAVYGIGTFVAAGGLAALLPEHVTAILVGWILAAFIGGQLIRRRYLG